MSIATPEKKVGFGEEELNSLLSQKKERMVQVRIGKNLCDLLDDYANKMNISRSALIYLALENYIREMEGIRKQKLQTDIETMFKEMTRYIELVPNGKGGMSMQMVQPEIIRLDGEGGQNEHGRT